MQLYKFTMAVTIDCVLATPAEVINHYHYFLADNLDSNVISQTMLKLEVITKGDLIDSGQMYSNYQQNAFLLDQLLIAGTSNIVEFCHMLSSENGQEIGKMLVMGKIMLNKNTWGVKKCGANQKQHCKQAGATKSLISAEAKKLLYQIFVTP